MPRIKRNYRTIVDSGLILGNSLLLVWGLIIIIPLLWVFLGAFKDNIQLYENPWGLPSEYHFENFARAWSEAQIGNFFFNSIAVTALSVSAGVFLAVLAAYVISRYPYRPVRFIFWAFIASMLLPLVLSLVPKFLIMRNTGLLDRHWGLILIYVSGGIPFGVFTMESFFSTLPRSFEESAYLDGAPPFTTFLLIIAPLTAPGVTVITIFLFLRSWNEFFHALVLISTPAKYTLPLGIVRLIEVQQYSIEWGPIFAGVIIVITPILLFFIFAQKGLVRGLTSGGLKG